MRPAELRTARLLLRPFRWGDVDDVLAYAADREWSRYLNVVVPYPYARKDAEEFVARQVLAPADGDDLTLAIVVGDVVIGSVSLRLDAPNGRAELGYAIGTAHWGKGYVPEAAAALIDYTFATLSLAKVYAIIDARNARSLRVAAKLGMTREGVLRQHRPAQDGSRSDDVYYGLLREEWQQRAGT